MKEYKGMYPPDFTTYPVVTHNVEPSMLIPLSLVMDLYAMATIADSKEVLEGLKKAIKGEK